MASNFDAIDLDWSWDGNFILGDDGDLKDTSEDPLLSLRNEISTIVKSNAGDWRESIEHGASLDDFVGEPNTRTTGKDLEQRLKNSLRILGSTSDFVVKVVPVHIHRVLVIVTANVLATPQNGMRAGQSITVSFLYDYFEKGVFVPVEEMTKYNGRDF